MAKNKNQKLKLMYLRRYLLENTDADHGVTITDIINYLSQNDIEAERKSLYDDIELLRVHDKINIVKQKKDKKVEYKVPERSFDLYELKLLGDAVESSRFITEKKSAELIGKLKGQCSRYEADKLMRQVLVSGRVRSMNESIYYNVDAIFEAISCERCIRFRYFNYNFKKEKVFRREGSYYEVSPYALTYSDENYYLISYDLATHSIRHFRVDRMQEMSVTQTPRDKDSYFTGIDLAEYTDMHFSMFGGDSVRLQLIFDKSLATAVYDRFGRDIACTDIDEHRFKVYVKVVVSEQFFGWLCGLGAGACICEPEKVKNDYVEFLERALLAAKGE